MREGWTKKTIGEIAELISRGRAPAYCENDGLLVVNQKCIRDGRINFELARRTDSKKKPIPDWAILRVGDALINSTGVGTLGRASLVSRLGELTTFDSHVTLVRPNPVLCDPFFIGLFLNSCENEIELFGGGSTGQTELSREAVSNFSIVLPPVCEQRRIVDLMSSVDSYIAALQQKADAARSARSAVLSELLAAGGDGWTETTLGEVLAIQSGFAFSTSDWTVKGYPVIKINNVRDGKVSTESCSFIADPIPQGAEKFLLKKGDLLITLTGEIGATGTVEQNFPMYLNQRVGRVSIHKESKVLLQYLAVLFNYPPVRAEMWSLGKGNAQLNISPKSIHEIEVNLPPLSEQRWTIEIISSMDEVIRSTEQAVVDAKNLRSGLLSDLLSGDHEIPGSYDRLLGAA